jgi:tetratricopeptide (TPR) repeat protein
MKEKINIRLLVSLLIVAFIGSAGWFFLHRFQAKRHVAALLDMATVAEAQGRPDRAARFVGLYLSLGGGDSAARIRYADLLEQQAGTAKALHRVMEVREQLLLDQPDNHDIRRRVVSAGLRLRLFDDTLRHVKILHEAFPKDGTIDYQLGLCLQGRGEDEKAAKSYEDAVEHAPNQIEAYDHLARLLHDRLDQPAKADKVMDDLVKKNQSSFQAYLVRADYRQTFGFALPKVEEDLKEARRLAPDNADVLLASERVARGTGNLEEARVYLKHATDKHPEDRRVYTAWAVQESAAGHVPEALKWLRLGVKDFPGDPELLFNLASSLIQNGDRAEAQEILAQMDRLKLLHAECDFLRARLLMGEEKWAEASLLLEATRPLLANSLDLSVRSQILLAECYGRLGDADRQIAALRQATITDPKSPLARSALAAILSKLGRVDEALEQYRRLLDLGQGPAGDWANVAGLEMLRNMKLPPAQQHWEPVEAALKQAEKQSPDGLQVPLLRAEALRAQGKIADARQLLEITRARFPRQLAPWVALAGLAEPVEAQRLLDIAEKQLAGKDEPPGLTADLLLARMAFLRSEKDLLTVQALEKKAVALKGGPDENARLLNGLAVAYLRLGKDAEATRLLKQVAELHPQDFQVRLVLFDLALRAGDLEGMDKAVAEIERLEGPGGAMGNYDRARLLVWRARQGDKKLIGQARELLAQVVARRPAWSPAALLQGEMDELEGKPDKALDSYLRAIELGERQPEVIRRVAEFLFQRQRYAEADQVLRKLLDESLVSTDLQKLGAEASLRALDRERALKLAKQAVPPESKNYRDHLWLGHLLWSVDHKSDAEVALNKAVELAGTAPDAWIALIQFFTAMGQKKQAEETLNRASKILTGDQAALGLAQCHEVLGQRDRAVELIGKAAAAQPTNVTVLRSAAEYYFQIGQVSKGVPLVRRILDPKLKADPTDLGWSRRALALALAAAGPYKDFQEALALLSQNEKATPSNRDDLYAKARVLATRPSQLERKQAIVVLKAMSEQQPLLAPEQFLLAQLYDADGNEASARKAMLSALAVEGNNPYYLHAYARFLLGHKEAQEARIWTEKLEQRQPNSFEAAALDVQLLAQQKLSGEAVKRIHEYVDGSDSLPNDPVDRRRRAAELLDRLSQRIPECKATFIPAAEELYRQWVDKSKQPQNVLVLADFLGRQDRTAEALAVCERALTTCGPDLVIATSLRVLEVVPTDDPRLGKVEQWLDAAILKRTDLNVALLTGLLAQLRERQGRFAEAKDLYGKVIQKDPSNFVALNNLAYILALEGDKTGLALRLVQQAIEITGPSGATLDTRAMASLHLGKNDLAVEDLLAALAEAPTPTRYYHLAVAYQRNGQRDQALKALNNAKDLGLQPNSLHPLERAGCAKMLVELASK